MRFEQLPGKNNILKECALDKSQGRYHNKDGELNLYEKGEIIVTTECSVRENVLLLCLSKVRFGPEKTKYIYKDSGKSIEVEGYMTNEAPAKVALSLVNLDRIVVICTDEVANHPRPAQDGEDKESVQETHYEYYKRKILEEVDAQNRGLPVFASVVISNDPSEQEIARAAVEAADTSLGMKNENKDVHVYIDYNGGLRYVAAMLLNIANLMEQRGAVVENIFTMNFENKDKDGRVPVENFMGILQSSRLVSGIKEYVDYGRCGELTKYFENCDDSEIQNIIKQMDAFSHNLNLCDVNRMLAQKSDGQKKAPDGSIETVKELLENYIQKDEPEDNVFAVLFRYVVEDILEEYQPLFDGDLLEMIDWCREKDYIQQAVTFYAERMPIYFWDKHIYYPTDAEEEEYQQIKDVCALCKSINKSNPYKGNDYTNDERNSWTLQQLKLEAEESYQEMTLEQLQYLIHNYLNYNLNAAWMVKYLSHGDNQNLDWMSGENRKHTVKYTSGSDAFENDRARTDVDCTNSRNARELYQILVDFSNIKAQRDTINHADDEDADPSKRWKYTTLTKNLKDYVDKIRRIIY